ncbi:LysR family transcriptional regulator [Cryptosporangium sp. NPDC051539]|uniref:LysR family transcriptional regulator n=1 Tax=Cryptosporangium sp. NPDC051539 TaxID=3363962 RepID=UPI0037B520AF
MRTFAAVAQHGSVRAAAAQLHVTEPAVSTAIGQLEAALGAELVARDGRGIRLTTAGEVYADYCRRILGLVEESESAVRGAGSGRLRIGAVATASEAVLPRLLASYRARFPAVELSLSVRPRDELFEELRRHETDLVVAGRAPDGRGLVSRATRPNSFVVVQAPGAGFDPRSATWLLRGPGSGTRETCLALFAQLQADPPTLTLGTHGAVVAAAKEGLGVTLVHADAVAGDLVSGALERLAVAGTPLARPWHVTTNAVPPASAVRFLAHIGSGEQVGEAAFHLRNRPRG